MILPHVLVADVGFLALTLVALRYAPPTMRRALRLLAVYVGLETLGHGVAEHGVALLIGRL